MKKKMKNKTSKAYGKNARPKFCFISFKAEDLAFYGPEYFESCSAALEGLKKDMEFIAEKMDYKYEDIYIGCIKYTEREVISLWKKETS